MRVELGIHDGSPRTPVLTLFWVVTRGERFIERGERMRERTNHLLSERRGERKVKNDERGIKKATNEK